MKTEKKTKNVTCSFCSGKGKDPFGVLSHLSTCCVCGGSGVVQVQVPYTHCAHCQGTGAVKTLTCTVCGGKGFVPAAVGPTIACPECRGTGDDTSAPAMACLKCRGLGWVGCPDKEADATGRSCKIPRKNRNTRKELKCK